MTASVANTRRGQIQDLEVRHRQCARCDDRIRTAKATGLGKLPLRNAARNRIWIFVAQFAQLLLAWSQLTALAGTPATNPSDTGRIITLTH